MGRLGGSVRTAQPPCCWAARAPCAAPDRPFLPIQNALVKPVFFHPNYPLDSQPINYVSRTSPRVFLGVSIKDDLINPQRNTKQLAEKLQELEVEVVLKEYPRSNHITIIAAFFRMLRLIGPVLDDVVFFVKE